MAEGNTSEVAQERGRRLDVRRDWPPRERFPGPRGHSGRIRSSVAAELGPVGQHAEDRRRGRRRARARRHCAPNHAANTVRISVTAAKIAWRAGVSPDDASHERPADKAAPEAPVKNPRAVFSAAIAASSLEMMSPDII